MPRQQDQTRKVVGGRNLPAYWDRFDRLQRTAHRLGGAVGSPRGVFRFPSFAAFEDWQWTQRLSRPARPSAPTS